MSTSTIACLPDIEQWLEDRQNRNAIDNFSGPISSLLEMCRCCGNQDCKDHQVFANTIKKLDQEARLAAVVGQQLLKKYEACSAEQERILQVMEEETQQRVQEAIQEMTEKLGKRTWECQKAEKLLRETEADLEATNSNRDELETALKASGEELEALRAAKMVADVSNSHETELQTKLNDANHELGYLRKREQTLESNHNELKKRYAQLLADQEALKQQMGNTTLLKSEKYDLNSITMRKDRKPNIASFSGLDGATHQSNFSHSQLLTFIKELAAANSTLKAELTQCKEQLSEAQGELEALNSNVQAFSETQSTTPNVATVRPARTRSCSSNSSKTRKKTLRRETKTKGHRSIIGKEDTIRTRARPTPTASTSTPSVVHHHYHYYIDSSDAGISDINEDAFERDEAKDKLFPLSISPSSSTVTSDSVGNEKSPSSLLHTYVVRMLERLRATDSRALNRPLRRTFNIEELSSMSNSAIGNILIDIDALGVRFTSTETNSRNVPAWAHDVAMPEFTEFVRLFQDLLKEIGDLRMTVNDLQVEYVKKVEKDGMRVEKEIMQRHESIRQRQDEQLAAPTSPSASSIRWLSSMFNRYNPAPSQPSLSSPSSPTFIPKTTYVPGKRMDGCENQIPSGPQPSILSPKPTRLQQPMTSKSTGALTKKTQHAEFQPSDDLLSSWKVQSFSLGWPGNK